MILNREEKDMIAIFRLAKKVSIKHDDSYFEIHNNPKNANKHYYLPETGHCYFTNAEETIESLKNLLNITTYEYRYKAGTKDAISEKKELMEKLEKEKKRLEEINEFLNKREIEK